MQSALDHGNYCHNLSNKTKLFFTATGNFKIIAIRRRGAFYSQNKLAFTLIYFYKVSATLVNQSYLGESIFLGREIA